MRHAKEKLRRIVTEEYLIGAAGLSHREDGPAIVVKYDDGSREEKYARFGKLHREDGPAVVVRGPKGKVRSEEYWVNGKRLDRQQFQKRKIAAASPR